MKSKGRLKQLAWSALCLLCLILIPAPQVYSQVDGAEIAKLQDLEPWETEDLQKQDHSGVRSIPNPARLPRALSLRLIRWYQRDIATRSIPRCPFSPSCSNFAVQAIERYGLLSGLCLFIDRNLYRENPQIYDLYNLVQISHGILKLDDQYFLRPEN